MGFPAPSPCSHCSILSPHQAWILFPLLICLISASTLWICSGWGWKAPEPIILIFVPSFFFSSHFCNLPLNCAPGPLFPHSQILFGSRTSQCLIHWFSWSCGQRKKFHNPVRIPTAPMGEEQFPPLPTFPLFVSKYSILHFPESFDPSDYPAPTFQALFLTTRFFQGFFGIWNFAKCFKNHFFSSL